MTLFLFCLSLLLSSCYQNPIKEHPSDIDDDLTSINISVNEGAFSQLINNSRCRDSEIPVQITVGNKTQEGRLKIHGFGSRQYPKKSFRLYFSKPIPETALFNNHFKPNSNRYHSSIILNAHTTDFSRVRNFLSLYSTQSLGGYSPKSGFVNLYLNGSYYGFYSSIERVREEFCQSRLNHTHVDIWKARWEWDRDKRADLRNGNNGFDPKKGDTLFLPQFSNMILDNSIKPSDIAPLVNLNIFSSWFLSTLLTGDVDTYQTNYYLIHDRLKNNLLFIRWDGDATFGRTYDGREVTAHINSRNPIPLTVPIRNNGLVEKLSNDNNFTKELYISWEKQKNRVYDELNYIITDLQRDLTKHILKDYERWNDINREYFTNNNMDYWPNLSNQELLKHQFNEIRAFLTLQRDLVTADLKKRFN